MTPGAMLARTWLKPLWRGILTAGWGERGRALAMGLGFFLFLSVLGGLFGPIVRHFWGQEAFGQALVRGIIYYLFLALGALTVFSAVVSMSARFFTAPDADFFLSRPVNEEAYFRYRYWQGALATSWMLLPFWLPLLYALKRASGASWAFMAWGLAAPLPLVWIACSLGAFLVMAAARRISLRRLRGGFAAAAAFLTVGLVLLLRGLQPGELTRPEATVTLEQFVRTWSPPPRLFDPLALAADSVMLALTDLPAALLRSALLWALAFALYLALARRAGRGFLRAWLGSRELSGGAQAGPGRASGLWMRGGGQARLLALKEFSALARNPVLRLQMMVVAALSGVFLYNLYRLPFDDNPGLRQLLFLPVCGFCQLILISVATRFIFPLESVEAQGAWLLRSAPISRRRWLLSRLWIYGPPLLLLSLILSAACVLAFKPERAQLFAACLLGAASPFGIAALTAFLGLAWKQRDLSQPEEVTTSPAGLLVMALCMAYVAAQLVLFYPALAELHRHQLQLMVPLKPLMLAVPGILWLALQAAAVLIPMRMASRRMAEAG